MIETANLILVACNAEILKAAIKGNSELETLLKVSVRSDWSEFGKKPLEYALKRITENPAESAWCTYFPIHKKDNRLIGSCGYKGKPSDNGIVEIGYEIAPDYRNKGLATEIVRAFVANAFQNKKVKSIMAHTLANPNASTRVLEKCGFVKIGDLDNSEVGTVWKWELKNEHGIL